MFEFHGWVNIKVDDSDDADIDILDTRLNELSRQIENKINNTEWPNCILRLYRGLNGENHLIMTGFRKPSATKNNKSFSMDSRKTILLLWFIACSR